MSPTLTRKEVRDGKIGHRRVDQETGEVSYKDVKSSALMQNIQLGLRTSLGRVQKRARRQDVLQKDFEEVEAVYFPK